MGNKCSKTSESDKINKKLDDPDPEASSVFVGSIAQMHKDRFKVVKIDNEDSVLVAKYNKKYYAIGDTCPHAGTSLAEAPIKNGRVRCPAHGACFDIESGDIEDFPGFDCIPSYKVKTVLTSLFVKINKKRLPLALGVVRPMTQMRDESLRVIIIGGGAAGYTCSQTLREEGYTGRIIMFTQDDYFPYDRTRLSKELDCEFEDVEIRDKSFYEYADIEVFTNVSVTKVDPKKHLVYTEGMPKSFESYDNLFIAVGLKPRFYAPTSVGSDLKNIIVLSSFTQYLKICEKAYGNDVVVSGSSFVAMEIAEMLSEIASHIHILSQGRVPYGLVFGETTARVIVEHMLKKHSNITFHAADEIRQFKGNNSGEVSAVHTVKKQIITCQLVVVAIGGLPSTEFLKDTEIQLNPVDHSIVVNKFLETNIPQIYAGGDVVTFPFHLSTRTQANVTHWQMACVHGKIAALNILGREIYVDDTIPHFWTSVSELNIQYIGYGEGYDETLIYGNVEKLCFCTVYRRRRRLGAVCCIDCGNLAAELILVFETHKDWIVDIPKPITKKFPNPPINGEAYHAMKHDIQVDLHEMDVKIVPEPMKRSEFESRGNDRYYHIPVGSGPPPQNEDDEQAFAIGIFNMRRDQQDRRRMDKLRHGEPKGNIKKNTTAATPKNLK